MNVNYKVVELDMLEYGSQFQDALHKMTGERTVSPAPGVLCPEVGGELGHLGPVSLCWEKWARHTLRLWIDKEMADLGTDS